MKIPIIGLGTWNIGGGMVPDYSSDGEEVEAIQNAIRMGYTHIDTAQMYGAGHTEELVGRAIRHFKRHELFITTKVWSTHLREPDVLREVEASLRRLGLSYIDLLLIHWPNKAISLEETFRAFNRLISDGTVRYVGVSNFSVVQLEEAKRHSEVPIATNQVEYNLLHREPELNGVLSYCQESSILLTAYEPLGKGSILQHKGLKVLADRYSVTVAQLAIAWLLQKPKVITIPKSTKEAHLRENLEVLNIALPPQAFDDMNALG